MADARLVCGIDLWPAAGLTLGETIERLVGPDDWNLLTVIVGDRPPPGVSSPTLLPLVPYAIDQWCTPPGGSRHADASRAAGKALRKCLALVDAWNAKRVIAKGRRGGPLEPAVELPPPATGWDVAIESLVRSVICEPGSGRAKLIYDVRFLPAPATVRTGPGHYATIREIADVHFPDGVDRVRPAVVVGTIANELNRRGQAVPSRDTILRAVGLRTK